MNITKVPPWLVHLLHRKCSFLRVIIILFFLTEADECVESHNGWMRIGNLLDLAPAITRSCGLSWVVGGAWFIMGGIRWRHGSQRPCASNKLKLALAHREEARAVSWSWRWRVSVLVLSIGKLLRPWPLHPSEWTGRDVRSLPLAYFAAFHSLFEF